MKRLIVLSLLLTSCATTRLERQQRSVLDCIKDMDLSEQYVTATFEVCRQVYRMKRVD